MGIQRNTTYLKHISTIQRCTQRYFEAALTDFSIGYGQQFFLLRISEQEGISLQELAKRGNYDKTTVTKAVRKLTEEHLVCSVPDPRDRRIHHLYLTDTAKVLIERLYEVRDRWKNQLTEGFSDQEKAQMEGFLSRMASRAWEMTEKGEYRL